MTTIKRFNPGFFIFLIFSFFTIANAQTEIGGFFDVINSTDMEAGQNTGFTVNQFEIAISQSYDSPISIDAAIGYNKDDGKMELADAVIHYTSKLGSEHIIFGTDTIHAHAGISIGQTDVPFGIDYLSFDAPVRPVVTQPLIYQKTVGEWSGTGINIHTTQKNYNLDLFSTNGLNGDLTFGAHSGFTFINNLEFGFSYAAEFSSIDTKSNWITGVDFAATLGSLDIKSEYLWTKNLLDAAQDTISSDKIYQGFYVQLSNDFENVINLPVFATARFGYWESEMDRDFSGDKDTQNRITLGLGYRTDYDAEVRIEYLSDQVEDDSRYNVLTLQLVTWMDMKSLVIR